MNEDDFAKRYAEMLTDIKFRIEVIRDVNSGKLVLPDGTEAEYVFLQFRMICELIALGCALAHNDLRSPDILTQWNADLLLKFIERLHPESYPKPMKTTRGPDGTIIVSEKSGDFLDRDKFKALYNRAGSFLHVGNLRDLEKGSKNVQSSEIVSWVNLIINLLDQHYITKRDGRSRWFATMQDRQSKIPTVRPATLTGSASNS